MLLGNDLEERYFHHQNRNLPCCHTTYVNPLERRRLSGQPDRSSQPHERTNCVLPSSPLTRATLLTLVVATIMLSLLPWYFTSEQSRRWLYADESGLFEVTSLWLWLGVASAMFIILRPFTWRVAAAAFVCLLAAAREADWHKHFAGYSVLKIGYYIDPSFPLTQRLLIGVIVAAGVACFIVVGLTCYRYLRHQEPHRMPWAQLLLIVVAVGIGSKVLDRTPAIAEDMFGITIPDMAQQMMQSKEEGLEMFLPVLLGFTVASFACWQRDKQRHGRVEATA
ncbi:hypothetical protein ACERK3_15710 [Phycisphaerales bacterium AB-hyl4]|uniref:Uncharacterized protein n=1 Tax=Natronomicrosphaera hydrolytica TaxID=3242702 RepID=A0ABV4U9P8_9BACT